MTSNEKSKSRVINYSNYHSTLRNHNTELQPEVEKQRNFKTIPNIPPLTEFKLQLNISATTDQNDRGLKEKASTVSRILSAIKSILPVLSFIRLLVFFFHQ